MNGKTHMSLDKMPQHQKAVSSPPKNANNSFPELQKLNLKFL